MLYNQLGPAWADLAARVASKAMGAPAVVAPRVEHRPDLRIPTADGQHLLADVWAPAGGGQVPTVLVRSPYGRRGLNGLLYGRLLAHQGFGAVVASCRGTGRPDERFSDPFRREAEDGQDTVRWLRQQPWFDGRLATMGASYLGYVQVMLGLDPPPELVGMVWQITPTSARGIVYPADVLEIETALGWTQGVNGPRRSLLATVAGFRRQKEAFDRAVRRLPLGDSYREATGGRVAFFEDWLDHSDPDDPYWEVSDGRPALDRVSVPVLVQGGWYDLFAADSIGQYRALRDRGVDAHLTMGPWTHGGFLTGWPTLFAEAVEWLRAAFTGDRSKLRRTPVRVRLRGERTWRHLDDWPDAGAGELRYHLRSGGVLAPDPAGRDGQVSYTYDPHDPTPSVGGGQLGRDAGARDNRTLEARPDVITFTGPELDADLVLAGQPSVSLWFSSTARSADVFARICDVHPDGRSVNLSDAIVRTGGAGVRKVDLALSPIGARIPAGHRVRLQLSSGAFPRFARNLGGGEPDGRAETVHQAEQTVCWGPGRPGQVALPVLPR